MKSLSAKCCCVLLILSASWVFAQTGGATAEIKGEVTDHAGAVVAGVTITATDADKNISRTATSNERGEYRLMLLPPGVYQLKVEAAGFVEQVQNGVEVTVGQTLNRDFGLQIGKVSETVAVTSEAAVIENERTQQSNTINEQYIRNLPINRRDYLSFTLLAPGVADSNALADNSDFRVKQTPQSGLSFYGSNGRGNSVTVDGAEANDSSGGVRPTLSQEAVQEFQINRSNYNAEFGGASGGVINIVSKTGTNNIRGSVFGFFRHQTLDAGDPFAIVLDENTNTTHRVKPDANRQQLGGTLGLPIITNRTFAFLSYEHLRRRENSAVPVLTDLSIFQPTAAQQTIINQLAANSSTTASPCLRGGPNLTPAACSAALQAALTAKPATQALFRTNSGVFPFTTDSNAFSMRIDHHPSDSNTFFARYNFNNSTDENQSTRALVGLSRSTNLDASDHNLAMGWTHVFSPQLVNEARLQWNYRKFNVQPNDPNGPELNVTGFGFFNRDIFLPARNIERRYEMADDLTYVLGTHRLKLGGSTLIHYASYDYETFFPGRFGFGTVSPALTAALFSPQLASTSLTALQALDLGLPASYQQGFGPQFPGKGIVKDTLPYYSVYAQDTWNVRPYLTFNYGLRYEVDVRKDPLPTYMKNISPRVGFAWDPFHDKKTSVRAGYGVFYAPIPFQIDYVVNALNEINGFRQIPQVLTTMNATFPLTTTSAPNIYRTLLQQGVIGIPATTRTIAPSDLSQFGIAVSQTGPRNPLTVLFRADPNYRNPVAQQASLGVERELAPGLSVSASYIWVLTQHITRARDINLLPRPIFPATGIPMWTAASGCVPSTLCFRDPLLFQEVIYESAASANYNGGILEISKRFNRSFSIAGNYTFSKAFDQVTDYNSDFRAMDQTNEKAERSLSAFDQRHKIVLYSVLQGPNRKDSDGLLKSILADNSLTPIFRYNSSRPFNLLAGVDVNGDRSTNGDRPPLVGRNTGVGPDFWTVDMRLARRIPLGVETRTLELTAEAFNLFNRLNFASINNTVGPNPPGTGSNQNPDLAQTVHVEGRRDRGPSQPLGFTSAFEPRRIQLGLRLRF
jgi:Carboxypeptidase regulatory-like domain/TonB dependent receptor